MIVKMIVSLLSLICVTSIYTINLKWYPHYEIFISIIAVLLHLQHYDFKVQIKLLVSEYKLVLFRIF